MEILIPKVIFDSLEQGREFYLTAIAIAAASGVIILSDLCKMRIEHSVTMQTLKMRSSYFRQKINFKAMDMDFENYISPAGKTAHEKAIQSVEGGMGNTLSGFFPGVIEFFSNGIGFLSFTAILMRLNPLIILALTLTYFFDSILMVRINRIINASKNERAAVFKRLRYIIQISRDSGFAKDMRIYTMSGWLKKIYAILISENSSLEKKVMAKQGFLLLIEGALIFARDGFAYAYLISRFLSGDPAKQISIGDLTVYFAAITGFGNWLSSVVSNAQTVITTSYALSDYRYFIEFPDKINRLPKEGLVQSAGCPDIVLRDVGFSFGNSDRVILDNINLSVRPGEKIALVGANGSGKSTLISLICGLLAPSRGDVLIGGKTLSDYGRDKYYNMFAVLFQNSGVIPASVSKNIALCDTDEIDNEKLRKSIEKAGLSKWVDSLPNGINTPLVNTVIPEAVSLSGGEKQSLLLARVIYNDAPVLILDEPTAALDPIAEAELYKKYDEITAGKTAIFVSHRLASTQFCSRIVLLDNAGIAEIGTHNELIALGGKYAEMYEKQSYYYKQP
ncbi:MAG: ABC transporter ATP-binding protein [Oscillospiraceae bacterium]|nr:ABC transporter ATP-binding protein [Oscillospiraceae bacterium]